MNTTLPLIIIFHLECVVVLCWVLPMVLVSASSRQRSLAVGMIRPLQGMQEKRVSTRLIYLMVYFFCFLFAQHRWLCYCNSKQNSRWICQLSHLQQSIQRSSRKNLFMIIMFSQRSNKISSPFLVSQFSCPPRSDDCSLLIHLNNFSRHCFFHLAYLTHPVSCWRFSHCTFVHVHLLSPLRWRPFPFCHWSALWRI